MNRLMLAAVLFSVSGGSAFAAVCAHPGGDFPDGPYQNGLVADGATTDGGLVNGSGTATITVIYDAGYGGQVSGSGLLSFCLPNPANTLLPTDIFVTDQHPISDGHSGLLTQFAFFINGTDYSASITYPGNGVAALQVLLPNGIYSLGITNIVMQSAGSSFNGITIPRDYSPDAITVSMVTEDQVPVPEPGSMTLLGLGLTFLATMRRRASTTAV